MNNAGQSNSNPEAQTMASAELPTHLLAKLRIDIPGYELLDKIASGGQATVYRAREITSGLTVAIKILHDGTGAGDWARDRLKREIVTLKALKHPNIVCVIESGCTPTGLDFLVMNYIAGRPLNVLWNDFKFAAQVAPEPSDRIRLFKRICDIVQVAHLKGITHRDLSPSNILLTDDGEPHILDFGLASTAFNELLTPHGEQVSVTGQFLGKVQYASPEQARGGRDAVDIRSDVYALGVILYQILTNGAFPYEVVGNLIDVLNNIVNSKPLPPSAVLASRQTSTLSRGPLRQVPSQVNEAIEAVVLKALEKDSTNRYQSAGELADDIDQYLAGRPTRAVPPGRPRTRRPRVIWRGLIAGTVSVVLLVTALMTLRGRGNKNAKQDESPSPAKTGLPAEYAAQPAALFHTLQQTRQIDLLKLVDPARDTVAGTWTLDQAGLSSSGNDGEMIEFPYSPPIEYDYSITFVRKKGTGPVRMICYLNKPFAWMMGSGDQGMQFSMWEDDNPGGSSNATTVNLDLSNGDEHTCTVAIRKSRAQVTLDGKLIESVDTDYAAFGFPAQFPRRLPEPRAIGLDSYRNSIVIRSAQILELTGGGTVLRSIPLPSPAIHLVNGISGAPVPAQEIASATGKLIDLTSAIDLDKQAVEGQWLKTPDGLLGGAPGIGAALRFPYEPSDNYDYAADFTVRTVYGDSDIGLELPHEGRPGHAHCSNRNGSLSDCAGWEMVGAIATPRPFFEAGKRYRMLVKLRPQNISVYLNDQLITQAKAQKGNHNGPPNWLYVGDNILGLDMWNATILVHSVTVRENGTPGKVLALSKLGDVPSLSRPVPSEKPLRVVDLMKLADLNSDIVKGSWHWNAAHELVSEASDSKGLESTLLRFPYRPPHEYDFRVAFTRTAGQWDLAALILVASRNNSQFCYCRDGNDCNLQNINGAWSNETNVRATNIIRTGRESVEVLHVREHYVAASIDGKMVIYHPTDYSDLSIPDSMSIGGLLGLATFSNECVIHSVEVAEITGQGEILRMDSAGKPGDKLNGTKAAVSVRALLVSAELNDDKQHGKAALASLRDLLAIDPQNATALALQAKIRAYYDFENIRHMKLSYIPAGSFMMGSPATEANRGHDEEQHKVTLTKPFYIGTTDVTRKQFLAFVVATAYETDAEKAGFSWVAGHSGWEKGVGLSWRNPGFPQGDDHPVVRVSGNDAVKFCEWLTTTEGLHFQLPTEAQWEYACRAGTTTAHYAGEDNEAINRSAWFRGNTDLHTNPVARKSPNAWGLYDMLGNVWQWCRDSYGPYPPGDATDPLQKQGHVYVYRGGSFYSPVGGCRAAVRGNFDGTGLYDVGFRVAVDAD